MAHIRHPEWRASNEPTKYPFAADATLTNNAGDMFLEGTFLDAHLYPIGAVEGLYIRQVELTYAYGEITIADAVQDVCRGRFTLPTPDNNVILEDFYGRPAGILVSERVRLALFLSWGIGNHIFEPAQTAFVTTCCMPTPEVGVRGIQLADGSLFTGSVWIVGDDGVVLTTETVQLPSTRCGEAPQTVEVIRVDVVGDPLFRRRLCNPLNLFNTPNPVRRLAIRDHGQLVALCTPDAHGNFSIQRNDSETADAVIRVRILPSGLLFEMVGDGVQG